MVVQYPEAVQWLPGCSTTNTESRSGRIGPISLEAKQTGERSARNPHAAFDEAGAGNVAWPRWCDTRTRKSEPTGNTNFGLNRRASPRPYLCGGRSAMSVPTAIPKLRRVLRRKKTEIPAHTDKQRDEVSPTCPESGEWHRHINALSAKSVKGQLPT